MATLVVTLSPCDLAILYVTDDERSAMVFGGRAASAADWRRATRTAPGAALCRRWAWMSRTRRAGPLPRPQPVTGATRHLLVFRLWEWLRPKKRCPSQENQLCDGSMRAQAALWAALLDYEAAPAFIIPPMLPLLYNRWRQRTTWPRKRGCPSGAYRRLWQTRRRSNMGEQTIVWEQLFPNCGSAPTLTAS